MSDNDRQQTPYRTQLEGKLKNKRKAANTQTRKIAELKGELREKLREKEEENKQLQLKTGVLEAEVERQKAILDNVKLCKKCKF